MPMAGRVAPAASCDGVKATTLPFELSHRLPDASKVSSAGLSEPKVEVMETAGTGVPEVASCAGLKALRLLLESLATHSFPALSKASS